MAERLEEFVIEAREHLAAVEEALLSLERAPTTPDAGANFDRSFRALHSIKGDAGFLGLRRIHELAHAMESYQYAAARPMPAGIVETLLAARDRLAVLVDDPAASERMEIRDIIERLKLEQSPRANVEFEIDLSTRTGGLGEYIRRIAGQRNVRDGRIVLEHVDLRTSLPTGAIRWMGRADGPLATARRERLEIELSGIATQRGGVLSWFQELSAAAQNISGTLTFLPVDLRQAMPGPPILWEGECDISGDRPLLAERLGLSTGSPPQAPASHVKPSLSIVPTPAYDVPNSAAIANAPAAAPVDGEKATTLRIQVELLDRLMTLVGELTLVRNQALLAFAGEDGPQRAIIQRLNSVTSELQDATLRARMQPVGNLFNRFPRMVRDLARQLGKQVEIELQGREVELDKTILEQLSDPLMHLIRNSVDHGIELPAQRRASGKAATGRIVLSATHEDGQVHIQIRDDGKGIDPAAVKAKALALRLKTEAELERLSPRELFSLILLPGFSTARSVTEVSGRGVGMDVVKTNIEQLEGTLNIDSVPGLGCSMMLRLPLTLAIIPCLVVTVDEERFAVPQRELEEVVCLHPAGAGRIEQAFETEVYRLRDRLLPIVRLREVLNRPRPFTPSAKAEILATHAAGASRGIEYILVLRIAGRRYGLVVDEVKGTQEVVVKPMHPSMKRVGIFAGSTIMGDGRVALIADSEGIIEHARLSFESTEIAASTASSVRDAAQAHRVLLFEYGPQEQFALPLIQIRRIELVSPERIERVGPHEYVTVDGVSTRILRLDSVLKASSSTHVEGQMSLILPKFVPQAMGILVSRIIDTESLAIELQQHVDQDRGILGTAIVRDRLTLFLDMHQLSEKLFGVAADRQSKPEVRRTKRLLLVDDTAFFREVVKRYLVAEGHDITTAVHGEDGLDQLTRGREFDLIVSDIEMPVMDGWEFAREARRRGIRTPMLALTSLSGAQYESKARDCGYDSYEVKLDHDRLVKKVGNLLAAAEAKR